MIDKEANTNRKCDQLRKHFYHSQYLVGSRAEEQNEICCRSGFSFFLFFPAPSFVRLSRAHKTHEKSFKSRQLLFNSLTFQFSDLSMHSILSLFFFPFSAPNTHEKAPENEKLSREGRAKAKGKRSDSRSSCFAHHKPSPSLIICMWLPLGFF